MKKVFLLLLFSLLGSLFSHAQTLYGLDPTFANNGMYIDSNTFRKVAIQNDDKIIVLGGAKTHLFRFNSNGTIDHNFGNNGNLNIYIPNSTWVYFYTAVIQPDGNIILGGTADTGVTNEDFLLVRIKPDGTMDSSFGGGGYIITPHIPQFGVWLKEYIASVAIEPNGNISAYGKFGQSDDSICIIRYKPDGRIDSSFGINGKSIPAREYGFEYPSPNNIALMPDGRIVIGATTKVNTLGAFAFTAIRLLPDGSLDTIFNHTGVAYTNTNLPGLLYCTAMQLQQDGKILLAGHADSLAIIRFDTSGKLDNSFGKNGLVKLAPAGKTSSLQILSSGKILLGGTLDTSFVVYRLNIDGSLDAGFGVNGKVTTKILNEKNEINGLGIQSTGKIIAAGNGEDLPWPNNYPISILLRYTENATHVWEYKENQDIYVYPNPVNDVLYVTNDAPYSTHTLSLYSLDGKLLFTQIFPDTYQLSTKSMTDGIYYLHICLTDHTTLVKKIIIQKH